METQPKCPSCGKPLAPNAPLGLCAECLMQGAFPTRSQTDFGNPAAPKTPRFVPPKTEALGPLFPQLEILEFIGQGGMGAVYRARQKQLGRIVALKILPPEVAVGPGFAGRFAREARALASLNHPNIVTLYEFGQAEGLYFFLMEFVDGVNLQELLRAGRVAAREALAIVPQICDALQFAHDLGIVHRDIKPGNILLSRRGQVKIADFGIAKMLGTMDGPGESGEAVTPENITQTAVGTPGYSAPEQKNDPTHVDTRADIYSLGVVFYEMLTGELPGKKIEPPSRKVHIDVRLDEIVLRAMEKNPERRYQQVREVRTLVETVANSGAADAPPANAPVHEPVLLKVSRCYYSTPEHLRSFIGNFIYIYRGKGELRLDEEKLAFTNDGDPTLIPLRAIQTLRVGSYSRFAKPARLDYLFVEFKTNDRLQQIILTPAQSPFTTTWATNERVADWLMAIRQAATKAGNPAVSSPSGAFAGRSAKSSRLAPRLIMAASLLPVVLLGVGLSLLLVAKKSVVSMHGKGLPLATSPQDLKSAPTTAVIQAGLSQPEVPWAWMELQNRVKAGRITADEAVKIMDDVTAWLRHDYPHGHNQPLNSLGELLKELNDRHLVAETNALALLDAYCGDPYIEPLPRVRKETQSLLLSCKLRSPWFNGLLGFEFLNEMRSITIDGQALPARYYSRQAWNQFQYDNRLELLNLAPGKHLVRCEVESAFVYSTNMGGLDIQAPPSDWPPAARRWTRVCQAEFTVYANDAELVSLSDDSAFDPQSNGSLSVKQIIIRPKDGRLTAVVAFNLVASPGPPVSVDVTLRLAGQTIQCGSLWAERDAHAGTTMSRLEFTANIGALDPQSKEAEILLAPDPKAIESRPGVDRIWGRDILFSHVPLLRQDLAAAAAPSTTTAADTNTAYPPKTFGPAVEIILPDFTAISLVSARVEPFPESALEKNRAAGNKNATDDWMVGQGMDIADFGDEGLIGLNMAMPIWKRMDWENTTADMVADTLFNRYTSARFILGAPFLKSATNSLFVFKTREDRLGLLQITGFTDKPREVKLRYKLVQASATPAPAPVKPPGQ